MKHTAGSARYALRLAYDGGAFRGFQRQPGLPSVQAALGAALAKLGVDARLDAAGRTDAGVHALGQVVSFSAALPCPVAELRARLNAHTPPGLVVVDAVEVPPRFHARASASARTYVYLVGWPPPEGLQPYTWALPDARAFPHLAAALPDLGLAGTALALAVGEHDFAGFARPGEQTARRRVDPTATVRTLARAEVIPAVGFPFAALVLSGRGFLRAMVRNLVGTAMAAALGVIAPERVGEILAQPEARYRGVRAPGWGLTLARVEYPEDPFAR